MKANELRIGNWYYTNNGKPDQIDGHGISQFQDGEVFDEVNDFIKPIPLTEEWLFKFGFVVTDGLFGNKYRKSIDFYTMKDKSIGFVFDDYCITIKYLHQLQNLYFALTGQELEIK